LVAAAARLDAVAMTTTRHLHALRAAHAADVEAVRASFRDACLDPSSLLKLHLRSHASHKGALAELRAEHDEALIRIRQASGAYGLREGAVTLSQDTLFRADVALPANLTEGAADLAVRYGPGNYGGHVSQLLMTETVLPVCAPRLMTGDHPIRSPGDLAHHTLLHDVSSDADPSRPDWAMWLKARKVRHPDPRRGSRYNQSSLLIEAAIAGRGVALAKRTLAQADLASGRLVAPFADGSEAVGFAYHVVMPRDRPASASALAFVTWLKRQAVDHDNNMDPL
jgi:hypothetical protein